MPELPEVETVRRGLAPVWEGRTIARVDQRRPDLRFPLPERFASRLEGRRLDRLERRAKYLVAHMSDGSALIMHLGMSGRFTVIGHQGDGVTQGVFVHGAPNHGAGTGPHDHIVFTLEDGARIVYSDHRRFGFMDLVDGRHLNASRHLAALGPEPLEAAFSPHHLMTSLRGKRTPIKAALLDQRVVAGLGNIYVCEALHRAGISPRRGASTVAGSAVKPTKRSVRLANAVKEVLGEAIEAGGSTLRDYAQADGSLGYFQHAFQVYGREGEPCRAPGCGSSVARIVQSGRSSFYCPRCQR